MIDGGPKPVLRAVFLDRDGVLNRLILNPATGEYESPLTRNDLEMIPSAAAALRLLRARGFLLFLISNQPNFAKGKSSLEELEAIHREFQKKLEAWGTPLDGYYYCYHHPEGIRPGFSGPCDCRKPGTRLVEQAMEKFRFQASESWFIGDRESDILCGKRAGFKTILILEPASVGKRGTTKPDLQANSLAEAAEMIK